ncbi:hypothetical protein T01_11399 [Trichinella spiralis]|uniref:Uncharacterized protein n=1 Tax=Trichinella spiralis TaxID=6334 RepID=A0A0V1BFK6_TRISP|nr:hypothetical protein T01_11399 [Trichinella spiralis]
MESSYIEINLQMEYTKIIICDRDCGGADVGHFETNASCKLFNQDWKYEEAISGRVLDGDSLTNRSFSPCGCRSKDVVKVKVKLCTWPHEATNQVLHVDSRRAK